jgi:hypothetical protein
MPELPIPRILQDRHLLFNDIAALLHEASQPVTTRGKSFMEWLRGIDPQAEHLARKMAAQRNADELVVQRTQLFNHLQQMINAATEAEIAEIRRHVRVRQAYWEAMEAEQASRHQWALREARARTELAEEFVRHQRLLSPAPEPAADTQALADPISQERYRRRQITSGKRALIRDCVNEMRHLFDANMDDDERRAHMRAVLDSYEMEVEDMPKYVQRFLRSADDEDY